MRLIDAERIVYSWIIDKDGEKHDGITLQSIIDKLPTVDAEPVRHGRWQKERNPMMYQIVPYVYVCSQCGTAFEYETPYCGECGAKMDEVEDG